MHLSRKTIAIIALALILAASNVAFAVLYMTKNVNISGGVATSGAIEVYDTDGTTPLTSYDFPMFTPGAAQYLHKDLFINNTGSVPVYVYWNMSSSSITWSAASAGYDHYEGSDRKYSASIFELEDYTPWYLNEAVVLGVGEGQQFEFYLDYYGSPNTAETFTLVMSFYAQDA